MSVGATGRGGEDNMCFLTIKESNRDYDGDWECEVFFTIVCFYLLWPVFVAWCFVACFLVLLIVWLLGKSVVLFYLFDLLASLLPWRVFAIQPLPTSF